jgi:flagellar motor switch protein FliN/FliY
LKLRRGSVVELDKLVGQPADLLINSTLMARGEVIVINDRFAFRISKFMTPPDAQS